MNVLGGINALFMLLGLNSTYFIVPSIILIFIYWKTRKLWLSLWSTVVVTYILGFSVYLYQPKIVLIDGPGADSLGVWLFVATVISVNTILISGILGLIKLLISKVNKKPN